MGEGRGFECLVLFFGIILKKGAGWGPVSEKNGAYFRGVGEAWGGGSSSSIISISFVIEKYILSMAFKNSAFCFSAPLKVFNFGCGTGESETF